MANDAKQMFNDKMNDLSFTDSWSRDGVELAVLGSILVGAGSLAARGNFNNIAKSGKRSVSAVGKGLDNYMKRRSTPRTRLGYQIGKKSFDKLRWMDNPKKQSTKQLSDLLGVSAKEIDNNPKIQREIDDQIASIVSRERAKNARLGKSYDEEMRSSVLYDKIRQDMIEGKAGISEGYATREANNINRKVNRETNPKKKLFNVRDNTSEFITSGVTGLGFGAGLTGLHALDRKLSEADNEKKVEDDLENSGSFLPKKGSDQMKNLFSSTGLNKQADSLDVYNRLKGIKGKYPEALASGLGFTTASLGAAALMKKKNELESENNGENKGGGNSRVIIELGNNDNDDSLAQPPSHRMSGLSSRSDYMKESATKEESMQKTAFPTPGFFKNLKGHSDEINRLKDLDADAIAAERLKDSNIDDALSKNYGNMVDDKTRPNFINRLFDKEQHTAQNEINQKIRGLEKGTADARLKAGGAALGAGTGLAGASGVYHASKKDKKNEGGKQPWNESQ